MAHRTEVKDKIPVGSRPQVGRKALGMVVAPAMRPAVRDAETRLRAAPQDAERIPLVELQDAETRVRAALQADVERILLAVQGDPPGHVSLLSSANRM
ncbi:MAG: hypothetical protein ABIY38_02330 [Rhodococcus sp. (in: high G+C Gram-positive bacteria)]